MAPIVASMSAKPVRMIRTVVGWCSKTFERNSTPVISGMRWSESTTATGAFAFISSRAAGADVEVSTS